MAPDRDRTSGEHDQVAVVVGRRVLVDGALRPASVHIENGRIAAIDEPQAVPAGAAVVDAGDAVVMAGLVDTHVHVNEPGRTAWEGFASATAAAAAGGVTTLVDMPLNCIPPTTTAEGLAAKREAAGGAVHIDVGFWGGVVPGNGADLRPLIDAGVLGFKAFLVDSGVDEFPPVGETEMVPAMHILGEAAVPLLVHAEVPGPLAAALARLSGADPRQYRTFLDSRPQAAEAEAIDLALRACRATGAPLHVVHHSAADAIGALERGKDEGLPLTVETCPHYLHFAAEAIADGATQFKCCPPIREQRNREALWGALAGGVIDMVVSDHSPCTGDLKLLDAGDFMAAWGGIASLQLGLAATWTEARARGYGIADLARWMSEAPARLAGLSARKGTLAPGRDADLVIWHPERELTVHAEALRHRNPVTPYDGERLHGAVEATILGGRIIYRDGNLDPRPHGRLLTRS